MPYYSKKRSKNDLVFLELVASSWESWEMNWATQLLQRPSFVGESIDF